MSSLPALTHACRFLACWAIALGLGWFSTAMAALPTPWRIDFTDSVKTAAAQGKQNLLLITGVKWEESSRRFAEEVLLKPGFADLLADRFELTHIDLPETPRPDCELSESEARDYALVKALRPPMIPLLYICTVDGRPYGTVRYDNRPAEELVQEILTKREAYDTVTAKIARLEGAERAREIDVWLRTVPQALHASHPDMLQKLIDADRDDVTGLRSKYLLADQVPRARMLRYNGDLDKAEKLYRGILKELRMSDVERQDINYELADVYFQRKDYDSLLDTIEQAIACAPRGVRMPILLEMMQVFTRSWIYVRYDEARMKAVDYDYKRITVGPDDRLKLLELVEKALATTPKGKRADELAAMKKELTTPPAPTSPSFNLPPNGIKRATGHPYGVSLLDPEARHLTGGGASSWCLRSRTGFLDRPLHSGGKPDSGGSQRAGAASATGVAVSKADAIMTGSTTPLEWKVA